MTMGRTGEFTGELTDKERLLAARIWRNHAARRYNAVPVWFCQAIKLAYQIGQYTASAGSLPSPNLSRGDEALALSMIPPGARSAAAEKSRSPEP